MRNMRTFEKNETGTGGKGGNHAAQVNAEVNAPVAPAPAQAAPVAPEAPRNRYDTLFESITFSPSDSDRVFENERTGQKSRKLANVAAVLIGGFAAIPGTIYGRREKSGRTYAEFVFAGSMQQSAVKPVDESSRAELAEFKRGVVEQYAAWKNAQPASTVVKAKPTALEMDIDGF